MSERDEKRRILREHRAWNREAGRVQSKLFEEHAFFDPEDRAQVKYEMLRSREVEAAPLAAACAELGFTRESYRHLRERFREEGMVSLFERKRGRKGPVKATGEVRETLRRLREEEPDLTPEELSARCREETEVKVSRRTVYRVLEETRSEGRKKKRQRRRESSG